MNIFILLCLLSINLLHANERYGSTFIATFDGSEPNFDPLYELGYIFDRKINIGSGFYRFVRDDTGTGSRTIDKVVSDEEELRRKDQHLISFKQERLWFREKKGLVKSRSKRAVTVLDANWSDQWYLDPRHSPSMGVYNVWDSGYTGEGVTVAIVDDGIQVNHTDLAANYNATLSVNIKTGSPDPSHIYDDDGHGTNCAGLVAAVKNTECVIGIAFDASMPAIRLLDSQLGSTSSEEAMAITHELQHIDIYSNSWGPSDNGANLISDLEEVQKAALVEGVTNGRGGKGAIYTWAAGNGGYNYDDCNVDGWANSMYTIAVTSLAPDSSAAWYSEECTSAMVATYGGDHTQDRMATTDIGNVCIDTFQGSSAACPVAAGIIALVLQANPELTWRDIQHMIVEHSTNTGLLNANFYTNGAGKKVSLSHGFGLMNAAAMVNAAPTWQTVPDRFRCEGATSNVSSFYNGTGTLSATFLLDNCLLGYLEHVLVHVYYKATYREFTSIYLISPSGTESRILRERYNDHEFTSVTWEFMSVHTWGENPSGTWVLEMRSSDSRNRMSLYNWKLTMYGTVTDPLSGTIPSAGEDGGHCNDSVTCTSVNSLCHTSWGVCASCKISYRVIDGKCVLDGSLGGYCDGSTTCIASNLLCNMTANRCQACENGYHIIIDSCIEDGVIGGYCDSAVACTDAGAGCESSSGTCIVCASGYSVIDNFCIQDGTVGGLCNDSIICLNKAHQCENNTCVAGQSEESSNTETNVGLIVGVTVGVIAGVAAIVAFVIVKACFATASVAPAAAKASGPVGANFAPQVVQKPADQTHFIAG